MKNYGRTTSKVLKIGEVWVPSISMVYFSSICKW